MSKHFQTWIPVYRGMPLFHRGVNNRLARLNGRWFPPKTKRRYWRRPAVWPMAFGKRVGSDFQAIRPFLPTDLSRSTSHPQWNLTPFRHLSATRTETRVENVWLRGCSRKRKNRGREERKKKKKKEGKKVRPRSQVVRRCWIQWKDDSCHVERAGVSPWNGYHVWKARLND